MLESRVLIGSLQTMRAILLAGGKGTRLYPYTVALPKPLVPIDDLPIIEVLLRQLKHYGVGEVTVSIGHLAEILTAFLGNGSKFGLKLDYVREDFPLGTVGPLKLITDLPEQFMLMNGDVLTDLDYAQFFADHLQSDAEVTIASFQKVVNIDLGVIKSDQRQVVDYIEKPKLPYEVSMGVYAIRRTALDLLPENKYFDFPMLIKALLAAGRKVRVYPFTGIWLDIGRPSDYEEAQNTFRNMRDRLLPGVR